MKRPLLFVLLVVIKLYAAAQTCAPNGITTNPSAPVNNQVPAKVNTFNWLSQVYGLNWIYDNSNAIMSPFFQTDNAITNHFIDNPEMQPADGWELIRRDFGFMDNGQPTNPVGGNPYLVLYNKYTGILRVFVARGDQAPFNGVQVFIKFHLQTPMQTSLLSQSRTLVPVDKFTRGPIIDAVSQFNNDYQRWFYADFNMIYDPCTCLYESKLHIGVFLVNSSNISLEGSTNGELVSMNNNQGTVNNAGRMWTLGNIAEGSKKLGSFYKSLNSYKTQEKQNVDNSPLPAAAKAAKKTAIESLANSVNSSSFLRNGLGAFPFIGEAVSLLDFFVGGGKKSTGPTTVKVMPMTINMTTRFQGQITALFSYKDIIFWNPGSNNASFNLNEYPYYNEVMGNFNLLRTPRVLVRSTHQMYTNPENPRQRYVHRTQSFRLPDNLEYIINPASGLEVQDLKVALIVEGSTLGPVAGGFFDDLESFDAETSKFQYRTEYVDVACLRQTIFTIEGRDEPGHINWFPNGNTYIKVMANLRRIGSDVNTQNVLFVARYPVTTQGSTNLGTLGACAPVPPQTASAVQSFCTSSAYTTQQRFVSYKENLDLAHQLADNARNEEDGNQLEEIVEVYPNPVEGNFEVRVINVTQETTMVATIKDVTGRVVRSTTLLITPSGYQSINFDATNFSPGMYVLIVHLGEKIEIKKLIIR